MDKKVAIITGASNGIGAEIALKLANENYFVLINYNKSEESANNVLNQITKSNHIALKYKADVSDFQECKEMVDFCLKNFGHIDLLVNNAGISSNNLLIDEDVNNISSIINTNLIGTINMCKIVSEHMISRQSGKIINISSIWGVCGASNETVYSASKGGIIAFTKALAKELAYNNILVNCIVPGVVDTNMLNEKIKTELDELKNEIPLNRFAKPSEIANLVNFLASENADYITGQVFQINGGLYI